MLMTTSGCPQGPGALPQLLVGLGKHFRARWPRPWAPGLSRGPRGTTAGCQKVSLLSIPGWGEPDRQRDTKRENNPAKRGPEGAGEELQGRPKSVSRDPDRSLSSLGLPGPFLEIQASEYCRCFWHAFCQVLRRLKSKSVWIRCNNATNYRAPFEVTSDVTGEAGAKACPALPCPSPKPRAGGVSWRFCSK